MRKDEFIKLLRQALAGVVPTSVIEENTRYYDGYITEEVRKGASEEDVIAEIGDPRLIAKTIGNTTDGANEHGYSEAYDDREQGRSSQERTPYGQPGGMHTFHLNKWYWKLLAMVVVFVVFFVVLSIIGSLFTLLIPLIGPLFMIWMIYLLLRTFGRR